MDIRIGNPVVGDSLREFILSDNAGNTFKLSDVVGKPLVLLFYPSEKVPICEQALLGMREAYSQFKSRGVRVLGIAISDPESQKAFATDHQIPFPLLNDPQFKISLLHGAIKPKGSQPAPGEKLEMNALRRTLLVGPDMRIVRIYDDPDPAAHPQQLLKDIDELIANDPPRRIVRQAPVLLISNVFPPELCQRLIQVWQEQGNEESGFMKQVDGKTVGLYDHSHKIRRDHFMKNETPELLEVKKCIGARVIPTITQAFNYDVSRFEDFRIACYDASRGGYFRPHRDNTTEGTAHRRFAMSLLLNNEYEGGTLRFPEFGLHEYRPEAGSAVIFSCSLLHEATDITSGLRYVLLSFFYGEKEAKIREAYNQRTGGNYRA